jgi:phosphoribosylformylglycinamidine cyclo-ligase
VRKIFEPTRERLSVYVESLGSTLGEALLEPTKIYVKAIQAVKSKVEIKAISHITGGGFIENIPRMLKDGTRATIQLGTWPVHPIFELMQELGGLKVEEMYNTFNMGIGMLIAVDEKEAEVALKLLEEAGEKAYCIGEVVEGEKGIDLCQE